MAANYGPADGYQEENLVRLPLSVALESRSGEFVQVNAGPSHDSFGKDSVIIDGYVEKLDEGRTKVVKRPGRSLWCQLNQESLVNTLMGMYYYAGRGLQVTDAKPTPTLAVAYNNKLWINPNGQTYTGERWTALPTAPWSNTTGGFTNTLQIIQVTNRVAVVSGRGGLRSVYRTTDAGQNWTLMTSAPGWVARADFKAIGTSSSSLYVMGGRNAAGTLLNDVWRSTDNGANWTQMTAAAGWSAREKFGLVNVGTTLYVMGGTDGVGVTNDVWKSTDNGANWTQMTAAAPWAAREQFGIAKNASTSRFMIAGGLSGGTSFVDAWSSTDGTTWTRDTDSMPLSARALASNLTIPFHSSSPTVRWIASDGSTSVYFALASSPSVWNQYDESTNVTVVPVQGAWGASSTSSSLDITRGASASSLFVIEVGAVYDRVFVDLFPNDMDPAIIFTDIEKIYFEGVPLPDLDRTPDSINHGKSTASPPLEGFFINSARDAYFYNTRSTSLTKVTSPNYPARVVGGAAWLNGRIYVMTEEGRIYCSGINDPLSWSALDFINAIMGADGGAGVVRSHNYLTAFGRSTTEWFYDSGAGIGNPLRRVDSAAHDFGCLDPGSVIKLNDITVFVGYHEESREVGVYVLEGYVPKKISTPFIDRMIAANAYDSVWSYPFFYNGHRLYVFNVCCINFTIVYDFDSNMWYLWTSRFVDLLDTPTITAALDSSSGLVEVTVDNLVEHFAIVGTPLIVSGAAQTEYNGNFVAHRILSSTSLTYMLDTGTVPTTPATGTLDIRILTGDGGSEWRTAATATSATQTTGFPLSNMYLLDRTNGNIFIADAEARRDGEGLVGVDDDTFINFLVRTPRFDANNSLKKFISRVELLGDDTDVQALVRYSDDDYKTWTPYRMVDMGLARARLSRQGSTRRRAYEVRQPYDNVNTVFRVEALEVFYKQGSNV